MPVKVTPANIPRLKKQYHIIIIKAKKSEANVAYTAFSVLSELRTLKKII